jgi:acetolactate synthase-1/2/3 large subunit
MADAYARVSGGLGVLITSTGPGAANAVSALVEARFAGSSVLHITGQTPTRFQGRDTGAVHHFPGQSAMLASVCKSVYQPRTPEQMLGFLAAAATDALSDPRGPVTIEIPADLQPAAAARPESFDRLVVPAPKAPAQQEQDALADLLAKAQRPMLWLGNGARGAAAEAMSLLDLGFGAVSSWNGRGIVPEDHPRTLGALHGNGAPAIEDFYEDVDAMVVVGSRLRGHETLDGVLRLPRTLAQVDADPRANGRSTYPTTLFVCGDAAATLAGLRRRLEGRIAVAPTFGQDLVQARHLAAQAYRATLGPYASFADQLRRAMPRDAVWVRDATVAGHTWAHRLLPVFGPRDSVHPVGGGIGPGLPFAIGAALAAARSTNSRGRKTVLLAGDGGFAMNMTELWTATQEGADICVIIMNDGIYAAIGFLQDAFQDGRRFFAELRGPDLRGLADLARLPFWRVDRAELFGDTVARAIATSGPSLVEVDMRAIGPVPAYGHRARKPAQATG